MGLGGAAGPYSSLKEVIEPKTGYSLIDREVLEESVDSFIDFQLQGCRFTVGTASRV